MRVELFPFQKRALADIRMKTAEAMGSYHRTHAPQVVSFTAPTGAGKTIIMSALIEAILFGDEQYMEQPDAIIVWLSDSPQLNAETVGHLQANEKWRWQDLYNLADACKYCSGKERQAVLYHR